MLPVAGDSFEEIFARDRKTFGGDDERFNLMAEEFFASTQRGVSQCCHDGAYAGIGFEKFFGEKCGDDFVRRVGIDVGFAAERADRREDVARAELAGDDGALGGVDDLLEDRFAGTKLDSERNHLRTITASTREKQEIIGMRLASGAKAPESMTHIRSTL